MNVGAYGMYMIPGIRRLRSHMRQMRYLPKPPKSSYQFLHYSTQTAAIHIEKVKWSDSDMSGNAKPEDPSKKAVISTFSPPHFTILQ